jgi:hypothetical protein
MSKHKPTDYASFSRQRLIDRIKFLEPYRQGMHTLSRQAGRVYRERDRIKQREAWRDKLRAFFHG